jgi:hypothetical protein
VCIASQSKLLNLARIYCRRSSRLRDEHHDHNIQALTHRISDLRLRSLADQVTRLSSFLTDSQSHVLTRIQNVNRISNLASNDMLLFGSKNDAQTAFKNVSDPILTRSVCPSSSSRFGQLTQSSSSRTGLPFRRAIQQDDKVVETFFGTFRMSSRTSLLFYNQSERSTCSKQEDRFEYENIFRLVPPGWLARFGFTYGLSGRISHSFLSGPMVALDVVRSVPDDAMIFDLCREGNLGCVQTLLSRGQASAKDVDSQGRTPLYVSSINFLQFPFHSLPSMSEKLLYSHLDYAFHVLMRYTRLLQMHATWNCVNSLFIVELTETHESMTTPTFLTTMCGKPTSAVHCEEKT